MPTMAAFTPSQITLTEAGSLASTAIFTDTVPKHGIVVLTMRTR